MKLAAARPIDLADARELVEINRATLDEEYRRSRAHAAGLAAELRHAEEPALAGPG